MNIVPFAHSGNAEVLEVLDSLRKEIESGAVIAFAAVGIAPDDGTSVWVAAEARVSVLRIIGAVAHMNKYVEDVI